MLLEVKAKAILTSTITVSCSMALFRPLQVRVLRQAVFVCRRGTWTRHG